MDAPIIEDDGLFNSKLLFHTQYAIIGAGLLNNVQKKDGHDTYGRAGSQTGHY
jgi:hypothetical protein